MVNGATMVFIVRKNNSNFCRRSRRKTIKKKERVLVETT